MYLLVINSGSSSIKYRLFTGDPPRDAGHGLLERIDTDSCRLHHVWIDPDCNEHSRQSLLPNADHAEGLGHIFAMLQETMPGSSQLAAIGHRVVHGGETYQRAILIDAEVLDTLRGLSPLAPLHNPANLSCIDLALALRPEVPQVAVFDTAFHQSMPAEACHYAVPRDWYRRFNVRRYGFHGSSHRYVAARTAEALGKPPDRISMIILHLGNGASATAIRSGRSVDTSMGMTPLEGLVMGTRSGDLDPSVVLHLLRQGMTPEQLESALNRESGLLGLTGVSDMRDVLARRAEGDTRAARAVDIYCYRVRKYIGAYTAVLGRVDALVFTGGVGENQAAIRASCCDGLDALGYRLDTARNASGIGDVYDIGAAHMTSRIMVVHTNEELQIAMETMAEVQRCHEAGAAVERP